MVLFFSFNVNSLHVPVCFAVLTDILCLCSVIHVKYLSFVVHLPVYEKSKDMNVYRFQCLDNLAISFRAKFLNCVQLMQNMTGSETKFPGVFFTNSFLDKNYY